MKSMVKLHNKKLSKEDRIDFSELVGKIFPTKYKQARRYALMRVAKMKDAEEFSFLGIEKLIEISRVVDFNSSPHPIKDMIDCIQKKNIPKELNGIMINLSE